MSKWDDYGSYENYKNQNYDRLKLEYEKEVAEGECQRTLEDFITGNWQCLD